eukprot:2323406-Pyramimonas_sp.AAC.1
MCVCVCRFVPRGGELGKARDTDAWGKTSLELIPVPKLGKPNSDGSLGDRASETEGIPKSGIAVR